MLERTINGTEAEDQAIQLEYQTRVTSQTGLPNCHTYLSDGSAPRLRRYARKAAADRKHRRRAFLHPPQAAETACSPSGLR